METYKNKNGNSGVTHYYIGEDYIDVKFKGKYFTIYSYTNKTCGKDHIDNMKKLAINGLGLGTYIVKHPIVKSNFVKKRLS